MGIGGQCVSASSMVASLDYDVQVGPPLTRTKYVKFMKWILRGPSLNVCFTFESDFAAPLAIRTMAVLTFIL